MSLSKNTIDELKTLYDQKKDEIKKRLGEFKEIYEEADEKRIFEELCFCILSSGVGPKVAQKSIDNIRDQLFNGNEDILFMKLKETHKYPEKVSYIIATRNYLNEEFDLKIKEKLDSISDIQERRDFIANNKGIKGIGYVQASHFLRNIGYSGYAILDKNIVKTLFEFSLTEDTKPPSSKKRYLEKENKVKQLAEILDIHIDEVDLLLWSRRTGHVPR